ncbi:HAMP domain-containing protein, partial [Chloroflexota bacterium]
EDCCLGLIAVDLNTTLMDNQFKEETILIASLGVLTFLLTGSGLALVLRRTILKPLSLLSQSAHQITRGEYSERVINNKDDEIGMLAQSFNEMVENIEQRKRELEESNNKVSALNVGLEGKIKQRTREISALNEVLTIINQSSDEENMLSTILTSILDETQLASGIVHIIDQKSNELVCITQKGLSKEYAEKLMKLKIGEYIQGQVFQSKEVIVVNDCHINSETYAMIGDEGKFQCCICIPIKSENNVLGTLSLASYTPERFGPETVGILLTISEAMCIAIDKARASQSMEESNTVREQLLKRLISAQEEERRRIARELHDAASQSLAALALNLEAISGDLPSEYESMRERLALLKEQAIETMGGVRELAVELRPSILDELGLARAIKSYAKDYLNKRGIDVKINTNSSDTKLPPYSETILFRIAQEALTNVVKHADATHVVVDLNVDNSYATMRVEDNGKGFDPQSVMRSTNLRQSLGIYSMSERATLLGGVFKIESEVGKGTFIIAEIPLVDVVMTHG